MGMHLLSSQKKNDVLLSMIRQIKMRTTDIILENKKDLDLFASSDRALYDRLVVDEQKVESMIKSVQDIYDDSDPIGQVKYNWTHPNGMKVVNKTAPFGTILIIYESRPDVTIEAAVVAFKSNNRILLKGGKEAKHTNRILLHCWRQALEENKLDKDWISLLELDRVQTQNFLKNPPLKIDLIVPRGGEGLITFVKSIATCPVLVSGRGNNFLYVDKECDEEMAHEIILVSKIQKISACNALDKVLINKDIDNHDVFVTNLIDLLLSNGVEVILDAKLYSSEFADKVQLIANIDIWNEEFLAKKIVLGQVENVDQAIESINRYSGGHSASIISKNEEVASHFMNNVDVAAVYHNASTRFTDGGQMGMGAELAISTDKLHHRGPLGLHQLVTNKWYVFGSGQIRE